MTPNERHTDRVPKRDGPSTEASGDMIRVTHLRSALMVEVLDRAALVEQKSILKPLLLSARPVPFVEGLLIMQASCFSLASSPRSDCIVPVPS